MASVIDKDCIGGVHRLCSAEMEMARGEGPIGNVAGREKGWGLE